MRDIDVGEMAVILSCLEAKPPITQALDKWKSDFKSQREHMVRWLLKQPMSNPNAKAFSYTRKVGNTSTKTMYNRFMNPGGLLWMAEAFGVDESVLRRAVDAAIAAEKDNYRKRSIAFRSIIPFEKIMEAFAVPEKWRYDSEVFPLLWFDGSGVPHIAPEQKDRFFVRSRLGKIAQNAGRSAYASKAFDRITKPKE